MAPTRFPLHLHHTVRVGTLASDLLELVAAHHAAARTAQTPAAVALTRHTTRGSSSSTRSRQQPALAAVGAVQRFLQYCNRRYARLPLWVYMGLLRPLEQGVHQLINYQREGNLRSAPLHASKHNRGDDKVRTRVHVYAQTNMRTQQAERAASRSSAGALCLPLPPAAVVF